jgi:S-methylmethionine-dependent homocysteine/selenocysteine methylase
VPTRLPLWSAHALADEADRLTLRAIHEDYARAGADIVVTNTFRTNLRTLDRAGRKSDWRELNRRAVQAARDGVAAAGASTLVAGGLAPLEDCYSPELVPEYEVCYDEHRRQAELLAQLGVDLILIETMNAAREATAALRAAAETGADDVISLCPKPPAQLLSGESLEQVVPEIIDLGAMNLKGVLLNCATPEVMEACYPKLIELAGSVPHGIYPHIGEPDDSTGWKLPPAGEPGPLAERLLSWIDVGTAFIGGCCGTTPQHINALRRGIDKRS